MNKYIGDRLRLEDFIQEEIDRFYGKKDQSLESFAILCRAVIKAQEKYQDHIEIPHASYRICNASINMDSNERDPVESIMDLACDLETSPYFRYADEREQKKAWNELKMLIEKL